MRWRDFEVAWCCVMCAPHMHGFLSGGRRRRWGAMADVAPVVALCSGVAVFALFKHSTEYARTRTEKRARF